MGEIKAGLFVSLDGVTEAPQTWHFPYFDDEMGATVGALMATDATLFGRVTYAEMASYWPNADPDDPTTAMMNGARKYVVSDTLTSADWENSTLITGDTAADEIAKLKQDHRLGVTGSVTLVRWLLEQRLLDELHLLVHPIIVGHGKRLFPDGATVPLKLLSSTAFASGVLHVVYTPADALVSEPTGS